MVGPKMTKTPSKAKRHHCYLSIYSKSKRLLLGQILLAVREFENTPCSLQPSPQNCSPCQANAGLSKAVMPCSISMSIRCDLILRELPPVHGAPPLSFALRRPSNKMCKTRARAGLWPLRGFTFVDLVIWFLSLKWTSLFILTYDVSQNLCHMAPASLKWELLFACHLKILWQTRQVPGTGSSLISALLPPWLPPLSPIFFVLCRFPEANLWMSSWALTSEQAFLLLPTGCRSSSSRLPCCVFYICPLTYETKIQMQTSWVGRSTRLSPTHQCHGSSLGGIGKKAGPNWTQLLLPLLVSRW